MGHAKTWSLEGVAVCQGDSSGTVDPWGDSGPAMGGHLPLVPMRSPIGTLCMQCSKNTGFVGLQCPGEQRQLSTGIHGMMHRWPCPSSVLVLVPMSPRLEHSHS